MAVDHKHLKRYYDTSGCDNDSKNFILPRMGDDYGFRNRYNFSLDNSFFLYPEILRERDNIDWYERLSHQVKMNLFS